MPKFKVVLSVGILLLSSLTLSFAKAQDAEKTEASTLPQVEVQVQSPEKATTAKPLDLPDGWQKCNQKRMTIAYINALAIWQRAILSPYRGFLLWDYERCGKKLFPETETFMEVNYPLPYVPIDPKTNRTAVESSPHPSGETL
jgi:hypothetical protein